MLDKFSQKVNNIVVLQRSEGIMSKSLYSLILDDGVIAGVDALAAEKHVSRSALINEILADHCCYVTPEQQTRNLFRELEQLLLGSPFQILPASNNRSIAMKTNLDCKYKPTLRYEFEIRRQREHYDCNLKAAWRTTDSELQRRITEFLQYWITAEQKYRRYAADTKYTIENGRIIRYFRIAGDASVGEIKTAIVAFLQAFNDAIKQYTVGDDPRYADVETAYLAYLQNSESHI